MTTSRAIQVNRTAAGTTAAALTTVTLAEPAPGEVLVEVRYSAINYKDALAVTGQGKILRRLPLIPGVDLVGRVVASQDYRFREDDEVLVTGCGLGEERDGGFAEYARVPAASLIRLPATLTPREAITMGTAAFTAGLAIQRLEDNRQSPTQGPLVVTGASGGVGGFAIDLLTVMGYEVAAVTGKPALSSYLQSLGASRIIDRHTLEFGQRPLEHAQWGGAVDNLGGDYLTWLTRTVKPWGNIVAIGLAATPTLNMTVMPFILRGVSLLGVTAADCPAAWRQRIWQRLGQELKPRRLAQIHTTEITLAEVPQACQLIHSGQSHGRYLVRLRGD